MRGKGRENLRQTPVEHRTHGGARSQDLSQNQESAAKPTEPPHALTRHIYALDGVVEFEGCFSSLVISVNGKMIDLHKFCFLQVAEST